MGLLYIGGNNNSRRVGVPVIPAQAVEAALKTWGDWPEGVSPQEQMTRMLEAAAPHMLADLAARMAGNDTGTYWDERRDHLTEGGTVRPDEQGDGYLCGIEHAADWILKQAKNEGEK